MAHPLSRVNFDMALQCGECNVELLQSLVVSLGFVEALSSSILCFFPVGAIEAVVVYKRVAWY